MGEIYPRTRENSCWSHRHRRAVELGNSVPSPSGTPHAADEQESAPLDSFGDLTSFIDEYRTATEELASSLPEGHSVRDTPSGDWDENGQFEPGAGEMQAAFEWQCAWLGAYVAATADGDVTAASEALDKLEEWTKLPEVAPHTDDASKQIWVEQVIAPARTGEDTFLLEFVSGCEQ
ncbi:hypothetical protein [Microbacterium sp.]|uniref:hypothetical protein n=1 Tax=Microbacterium sp. TaxID=51671 RepID=UPI0035673F22